MGILLDAIFPRGCIVCSKKGEYLCERCKKYFKRNLPECYVCRRISPMYKTHDVCKDVFCLDSLFVGWEYNEISSEILKLLKYRYVSDLEDSLSKFFIECISRTSFKNVIRNTLLVSMPISKKRYSERGFNQVCSISKDLSKHLGLDYREDLLYRDEYGGHQSMKDRERRLIEGTGGFRVNNSINLSHYSGITIFDDVVTTGSTINKAVEVIKNTYSKDIPIFGICMFRGKPFYSETSSSEESAT